MAFLVCVHGFSTFRDDIGVVGHEWALRALRMDGITYIIYGRRREKRSYYVRTPSELIRGFLEMFEKCCSEREAEMSLYGLFIFIPIRPILTLEITRNYTLFLSRRN